MDTVARRRYAAKKGWDFIKKGMEFLWSRPKPDRSKQNRPKKIPGAEVVRRYGLWHADRIAKAAGAVVGAVGLAVLLGWTWDVVWLKSILAGLASMKANTALAFVLGGTAVILAAGSGRAGKRRGVRGVLHAAIAAAGLLSLIEYLAAVDLGIDELLFADPDAGSGSIPGRMSPISAVNFVLFAAAMALPGARANRAFVTLTTLGLLLATLALLGYAYGVPELYRPSPTTSIAMHTAGAFALLFVGAAATRPGAGWMGLLTSDRAGGTTARWLLPAVVLLPLLLGWLFIRGQVAGQYELRAGTALFAVSTVVLLATLAWISGRRGNRLHEALRTREQLSRAILESAFDAFILMDQDGRIIEWNPQAEQTFGWSRREAVGRSVGETVVPPSQRDAHARGLARFLATGQSSLLRRSVEMQAMRRDGSAFPAELIIVPIRQEGRLVFSGFVRDLTERKEAERQLRQSQKMQAVGQLTGGIAHDFNNLLTVIIGGVELLMDRTSGEIRDRIDVVMRAAERGAALTHRLLAFSRRQALQSEDLDLNGIVADMRDLLKRALGETIDVRLSLAPALWHVSADRAQVENALLNLAINARDAMPGGGRLTIGTGNASLDGDYARINPEVTPGDYVMVVVSDTGTGMPQEVLERAFEPFFTTKEAGRGTGLGLSIIYGFAKQAGGHVKIYSEVRQGTTVRLYLPRIAAVQDNALVAAEDVEPLGRGETILVVEDNPDVRRVGVGQLKRLGYRTIEAESGKAALVILESSAPIDLLFSDIVMAGGISGVQLAEKARALRPALRVVLTTGFADLGQHDQQVEEKDILRKPYRRRDLAVRINERLRAGQDGTVAASSAAAAPVSLTGPLQSPPQDWTGWAPQGEAAADALLAEYERWTLEQVAALRAALTGAQADPGSVSAAVRRIAEIAHDMKGQGSSFGYPLVTRVARSLERLTTASTDRPSPDRLTAIAAHIQALTAIVERRIRGDGGAVGAKLAARLEGMLAP